MDCKQVNQTLFLFVDNEMEAGELVPFENHVELCPGCARQLDYTKRFLILIRERCVRENAPDHLRVRILTNMPHRADQNGHAAH